MPRKTPTTSPREVGELGAEKTQLESHHDIIRLKASLEPAEKKQLDRLENELPEHYVHSLKVALGAKWMAEYVSREGVRVSQNDLAKAGLLHDVGKLHWAAKFFLKRPELFKGKVTGFLARKAMRLHPGHSKRLLKAAGTKEIGVIHAVYGHHLRLSLPSGEGPAKKGYPSRAQASISTEILRAADTLDAEMRPYPGATPEFVDPVKKAREAYRKSDSYDAIYASFITKRARKILKKSASE